MRIPVLAAMAAMLLGIPANAGRAAPRVIVTMAPIHGLAASVMDGVVQPHLLVRAGSSPHGYRLRPSDARALAKADIVVWIGPALESFLVRPIATLAGGATVIQLSDVPGMQVLKARRSDDDGSDREGPGHGHTGDIDPHLWLSPENARTIAQAVGYAILARDPENAARYEANLARTLKRIDDLERDMNVLLEPVRKIPFATFHDAFQYFERHFGLNGIGWIAVDPGRRPGARRLGRIRERIATSRARCVFTEPQFPSGLLAAVVQGTDALIGRLDPLGAGIAPGPEHWFDLMRRLADDFVRCLAR